MISIFELKKEWNELNAKTGAVLGGLYGVLRGAGKGFIHSREEDKLAMTLIGSAVGGLLGAGAGAIGGHYLGKQFKGPISK